MLFLATSVQQLLFLSRRNVPDSQNHTRFSFPDLLSDARALERSTSGGCCQTKQKWTVWW